MELYKQQKDDVLMLTWGVGEQKAYKRTDIISQARSDDKYYYLSRDKFVIFCNVYYQEIPMWENVLPYLLGGIFVLGVIIILLFWKRDSSRPLMKNIISVGDIGKIEYRGRTIQASYKYDEITNSGKEKR